MTRTRLKLTFAGVDPDALIRFAVAAEVLPASQPTSLRVEGVQVDPAKRLDSFVAGEFTARWGDAAMLSVNRKHDNLFIAHEAEDVTAEQTVALVRDWPFEACTSNPLHAWPGYRSIHGWAFILKGDGHRLVSPRILDRGPWRKVRDDSRDVTLLQFHDLDTDADTALAQAKPGHALLAPVWLGGHYASQLWVFRGSAQAVGYQPTFYDPETRTSVVLVQNREVSAAEMGVASATRVHQIFPQPVEQVRFVYMDEATARRQLPALWLHGLEVRAMTAQGERRIDEDYVPAPPPPPPSWVTKLG